MIGFVQVGLSPMDIENKFNMALYETVIMNQLKVSPKDPILYSLLGDLYQENKIYDKALSAYDTSLYTASGKSDGAEQSGLALGHMPG